MPTAKPRITITLSDEQHSTLQALAELQHVSMSSIVVDLVETTMPVLQRLVSVLKNASQAPQAVLDGLRASLESAEGDVFLHAEAVIGHLDSFVSIVDGDAVADLAQAGAAGASPEAEPPTSNRGVRNGSPDAKNTAVSPMKTGKKSGRAKR